MCALKQLHTAGFLRNYIFVQGASEDREEDFLIHHFHQAEWVGFFIWCEWQLHNLNASRAIILVHLDLVALYRIVWRVVWVEAIVDLMREFSAVRFCMDSLMLPSCSLRRSTLSSLPFMEASCAIKASSLWSVSASLSTGWAFLGGIIDGTQQKVSKLTLNVSVNLTKKVSSEVAQAAYVYVGFITY